jgi:hypothetical protein
VYSYRLQNKWPGYLDPDLVAAINSSSYGSAVVGGFYAGVIDTAQYSADIDTNDIRQTGQRYALIVSPRAIGLNSSALTWRTTQSAVTQARTRWDGLHVTNHIINNETLANFPIFNFCNNVRSSNPPPETFNGSQWYIPALDEVQMIYRHLKPITNNNEVGTTDGIMPFPTGTFAFGANLSSDPQAPANTTTVPGQTSVTVFQGTNSENINTPENRIMSSTQASTQRHWNVIVGGTSNLGQPDYPTKTSSSYTRLVRRVLLP